MCVYVCVCVSLVGIMNNKINKYVCVCVCVHQLQVINIMQTLTSLSHISCKIFETKMMDKMVHCFQYHISAHAYPGPSQSS